MLETTCEVAILKVFYAFFGSFADKVSQTWLKVVKSENHNYCVGIYYCVEVVKSENHNYMIEITS